MNQQQNGFVSLLTTIMISLLLLIITTSLVSLETLQLRKAENSEQTMRAYYAAEAGIEDAVAKVLNGSVTADQPCVAGPANYDAVGEVQWTCQQISFSGSPSGRLDNPDEARTIDLGQVAGGFDSVLLEWDTSNETGKSYVYDDAPTLISAGAYIAKYAPAPIELTTVKYPTGGNIPSSAISTEVTLHNALILPGGGNSGNPDSATPAPPLTSSCDPGRTNGGGVAGYAGASTKYNCYILLTNFNDPPDDVNKDYLFRIRSRYVGTAFKMTFMKGGAEVAVNDGTANIDVTAKAGDTYRRVVTKLPLTKGASGKLNYVLYSDGNICKNFDVLSNVASPPGC